MMAMEETGRVLDYDKLLKKASVSPSDLAVSGGCLLRVIPNRYWLSTNDAKRLLSKEQISGFFFHEIMKRVSDIDYLEKKARKLALYDVFEELINIYETRYRDECAASTMQFRDWPELTGIFRTAEEELKAVKLEDGVVRSEQWWRAKEGRYFGQIDQVIIKPTSVLIRDFKLRHSIEGLSSQERYKNQLHFYAFLIAENFPGRHITLELVGLNKAVLSVAMEEQRMSRILEKANQFIIFLREIGEHQRSLDSLCPGCDRCSSFIQSGK